MIAIKNTSKKEVRAAFDGKALVFAPGEMKMLDPHAAGHLLHMVFASALGGSPFVQVAEKDIPEELLNSSPEQAASLKVLRNPSDKAKSVMSDGRQYNIPAKGKLVLPVAVAQAIYLNHAVNGLVIEDAVQKKDDKKDDKKEIKK